MAARRVIVKRLAAIENFGSMDVLCSDKTGTLTEGRVRLESALDASGLDSERVAFHAYLNAAFETGYANPIDAAIREQRAFDVAGWTRLDEIPYDNRRRLAVLLTDGTQWVMVVKGALAAVLGVCSHAEAPGSIVPAEEGAELALTALARLGVSLTMITGDSAAVAEHIARQVGMPAPVIITGGALQTIGDEARRVRAANTNVFAEIEPGQKERIIRAGVLAHRVREGRRTFANTLKYVFMATSATFGNMFSMAGPSMFLPFLPLLPKQILLLNLLTDFPELTIATDRVEADWIDRPRRWDVRFIRSCSGRRRRARAAVYSGGRRVRVRTDSHALPGGDGDDRDAVRRGCGRGKAALLPLVAHVSRDAQSPRATRAA
jgi:P-type Mg2+ transporter